MLNAAAFNALDANGLDDALMAEAAGYADAEDFISDFFDDEDANVLVPVAAAAFDIDEGAAWTMYESTASAAADFRAEAAAERRMMGLINF